MATIPATKAARQTKISDLLSQRPISSQKELCIALAEEGIIATQATVSRDLLEMRATKIRNVSGENIYVLPDAVASSATQKWNLEEAPSYKLTRWCQELLVGADVAGNILVLRTPLSGASLLASAIDSAVLENVLGCLAGDNTVILICKTESVSSKLRDYLLRLAEPSNKLH